MPRVGKRIAVVTGFTKQRSQTVLFIEDAVTALTLIFGRTHSQKIGDLAMTSMGLAGATQNTGLTGLLGHSR